MMDLILTAIPAVVVGALSTIVLKKTFKRIPGSAKVAIVVVVGAVVLLVLSNVVADPFSVEGAAEIISRGVGWVNAVFSAVGLVAGTGFAAGAFMGMMAG